MIKKIGNELNRIYYLLFRFKQRNLNGDRIKIIITEFKWRQKFKTYKIDANDMNKISNDEDIRNRPTKYVNEVTDE